MWEEKKFEVIEKWLRKKGDIKHEPKEEKSDVDESSHIENKKEEDEADKVDDSEAWESVHRPGE